MLKQRGKKMRHSMTLLYIYIIIHSRTNQYDFKQKEVSWSQQKIRRAT